MAKTKLGLINVGHGPRIDFISIHRNWFKAQGADVEIIGTGSLNGISYEELHEMEGPPFDPKKPVISPDTRMGSLVHREGVYDYILGEGWWEVWTPKKGNIPRIQKAIDYLEKAGAEIIILMCCLEYPENAFKSKVPFIQPWKVTFAYAQTLADTMHKPNIGILVKKGQTYERDVEIWTRRRWTRDVNIHFGQRPNDKFSMGDIGLPSKMDLIILYGYHSIDLRGGIPGDECLAIKVSEQYHCPVITSMSAALCFARGLLRPPIDERSFYNPMHK